MTMAARLTTPHPAKLSVADFMLLDRSGAFDGYSKTELIDGTIYVVNSQYSEHMTAKVTLLRRLADACDDLGQGLEAWSEGSVEMSPFSMPEPDLIVTRERPTTGPVRLSTVALIVEVSDTTAAFDLGRKATLYATQGVPEYWVVDLKKRIVHQMWSAHEAGYRDRRQVALGERAEAATIPGLAVETSGI